MAQPDIRGTVRKLILELQRWQASNRQPAVRGPSSGAVRVDVVLPPSDADQRRKERARGAAKTTDAEKPPTAQQRVERIARERQSTEDRGDLWLQQQRLGAGVLSSYTPAGLIRARIATSAFQQFGGAGIVGSQIAGQALGGSQAGRLALKAGGTAAQAAGAIQSIGPLVTSLVAPAIRQFFGGDAEGWFRGKAEEFSAMVKQATSQILAIIPAADQTKDLMKARLLLGGDKANISDAGDVFGAFHAVSALEEQRAGKAARITEGRQWDAVVSAIQTVLKNNTAGVADDVRKAISGAARMN